MSGVRRKKKKKLFRPGNGEAVLRFSNLDYYLLSRPKVKAASEDIANEPLGLIFTLLFNAERQAGNRTFDLDTKF